MRPLPLVTVAFLCACQPAPDVELERARTNFAESLRFAFSEDCQKVAVDVRRRQDKSIEGVVVWKSPMPATFTAVYRADSEAGWKCDAIQSSSAGACELLELHKLRNEVNRGDLRIEVPSKR